MDPVVRSLLIKGFRSFPSERVDLDNPTFVVGRNGAGKSNLVDAFAFLSDCMASPLQAVLDKRGGIAAVRHRSSTRSHPPNLGLGVALGAVNGAAAGGHYAFEIRALKNFGFEVVREQCWMVHRERSHWFERRGRSFTTNASGLKPDLDPASLALPVVGGDDRFAPALRALSALRAYAIQPGKLREMQDPDSGLALRPDGSNAASVLDEIRRSAPGEAERIQEVLSTIVPSTTKVRTIRHGQKLALEFVQQWAATKRLRFEAFNMSDGTLRALGLLVAVYQRPSPSLVAIEEPEETIHPGALGAILDVLLDATRRMQVVVTTHSPEVLDAKWIEARHLRFAIWDGGATRITTVAEPARKALDEHLMGAGELLRADALEPQKLFRADTDGQILFEDIA